jgi:hypothetical protein
MFPSKERFKNLSPFFPDKSVGCLTNHYRLHRRWVPEMVIIVQSRDSRYSTNNGFVVFALALLDEQRLCCVCFRQCNGATYSVSDIYGMGQYGPGTAEDEALTTEGCIVCLSEPRCVMLCPLTCSL